jgi:hypothetical protein
VTYNASEYMKAWRAKRRAAGLPVSGSKTWDPAKRDAWWTKNGDDQRAKSAARMRVYSRRPDVIIKNAARRAVRHALETGALKRLPCERCGLPKVEAHHDDYSRPLAIRWLCHGCHSQHHRRAKARGKR